MVREAKGHRLWEKAGYDTKNIGNIDLPVKLTDLNAFFLANTVTELYYPVDFYADRIVNFVYL